MKNSVWMYTCRRGPTVTFWDVGSAKACKDLTARFQGFGFRVEVLGFRV